MATKIRLQRHGKKGYPFYHVVVADSRAKRDGKFIEKLGVYNPNTNPATIDINFDQALNWVQVGAEMSDTARAILSYKGVLYKNHLIKGVKKGALTEADVEKKFESWLKDKAAKIEAKRDSILSTSEKAEKDRLTAEKAVSDARAKEIAAKNTPPVEEETPEAEAKTEEAPKVEEAKAEAPKTEETPKAEAKTAEETPKGEVKAEENAEVKTAKETPKGEVKEEAPKKEEKSAKETKEESKDKSAE